MIVTTIVLIGGSSLLVLGVLWHSLTNVNDTVSAELQTFLAQLRGSETELRTSATDLYDYATKKISDLVCQQSDLHAQTDLQVHQLGETIVRLQEVPIALNDAVNSSTQALVNSQSQLAEMMQELTVLRQGFVVTQTDQALLSAKDQKIDQLAQDNQCLMGLVDRMQQRLTELMLKYERSQSLTQSQHEEILRLQESMPGGASTFQNALQEESRKTHRFRFI